MEEGLEGLMKGYMNLHLLPMYTQKIAYGSNGFPWTLSDREIIYGKGLCPVAEKLNDQSFIGLEICLFEFSDNEIDLVLKVFRKVWKSLDKLK